MAILPRSARTALRMLTVASLLMAPVGALAYGQLDNLGIKKQGVGLVLLVTLQRQSMT